MKEKLPVKLLDDLEHIKGFNRQSFIDVHDNFQSITSIRYNNEKQKRFALTDTFVDPQLILMKKCHGVNMVFI